MKRIVLLGVWCWPFLAFGRSCRRENVRVYLLEVGGTGNRWQSYSSCLAGGAAIPPGRLGTPEGIKIIRQYTASINAHGLVSEKNDRLVWLARNRSVFEPLCRLLMPPFEVLRWTGSKSNQIELAVKVGFEVLPSTYLLKTSDCLGVPADRYPVVLRPDRRAGGVPAFKVKVARSPTELRAIVEFWGALCVPLIAQPMVRLPNLVVHGARSETGAILAMKAFLVPRKFKGVTLTIQPAEFPPGVERCCRDFVEQAGITGVFHFELLFSPERNRAWFLEINPRLGGTTDKVTALGFDEPSYLLKAYGIKVATRAMKIPGRRLAANKRTLLKHAQWAASGRLADIDYPDGPRFRQVLRSARDLCLAKNSIFDWRDWRGAFWIIPRRGRHR